MREARSRPNSKSPTRSNFEKVFFCFQFGGAFPRLHQGGHEEFLLVGNVQKHGIACHSTRFSSPISAKYAQVSVRAYAHARLDTDKQDILKPQIRAVFYSSVPTCSASLYRHEKHQ